MKIEVHTLKWYEDHALGTIEGDPGDANSLLNSVVLIDGVMIPEATSATIVAKGGDFVEVTVGFHVSDIKFVAYDNENWPYKEGIEAIHGRNEVRSVRDVTPAGRPHS